MECVEEQRVAVEMHVVSDLSQSAEPEIPIESEIESNPGLLEDVTESTEERSTESEIVEAVDPVDALDVDHYSSDSYHTSLLEAPEPSIEQQFANARVPSWREQLTIRAFVVSFMLTTLFTFVAIKVNLTTGLVPTVTIPAALLGCCVVQYWVSLLTRCGFVATPFSRQENTIIQTCFATAYEIAFSGGVGTYLLAMTRTIADQAGEGENAYTIDLSPSWVFPFLFCVSYTGCFVAVTLRKTMIQTLNLPFPSGTAAGDLINSFHVPRSAGTRRSQSLALLGSSGFSFAWACFKWLFTGGRGCGFNNFPTFGLLAFKQRLSFDSSATYVGMGMISPYKVTCSLLVGALLSWTILWPLIHAQKGEWFDASLGDNSFHGLQGYKVSVSLAIIFGDALYKFVSVLYSMITQQYYKCRKPSPDILPSQANILVGVSALSYDDERRAYYFSKDPISIWLAILVYISISAISFLILPFFYVSLRWYHIFVPYLVALPLAFCNAYGSGITDWSLAASYSRFVIFAMTAWAGVGEGGVLIGLGACGLITNIVSSSACISQDMKTGYMTLASPRAMLIAQVVGVTFGCILTPSVFFVLLRASPDIGAIGSDYPAPNALVFRLMAIVGAEGIGGLPKHCILLSLIGFFGALVLDIVASIGEVYEQRWVQFMPLPMAMAIPFYVGGSFVIDMCVGALILYLWGRLSRAYSDKYARIFASGLILGDGLWTMISSILPFVGVKPPMCLKVEMAS